MRAQAQFEKLIEQLKREHQAKVDDLQAELEAVTTLMEVEYRRLTSAAPVQDERAAARRRRPEAEPSPSGEHAAGA